VIKIAQIEMFFGKINSPVTTLSTGIDSSVTTISVTDASKLSLAPNLCTISGGENAETIKYTGISGNDLTGCTRGFQGTAQSWNMGVSVMRAFTAYDHDTFKNNIEDHADQINEHLSETMLYEGSKFTINNPYFPGGSLSLKGQLHCHTTNSDGLDSPSALVTAYKDAGFNFMTITDHNFITPDPSISGITWIGTSSEESQERHINAFDITIRDSTLINTQDIINFHRANNKITSLNHSNWNYDQDSISKAVLQDEILKLFDFNFIEVFNGTTGTYAETQWDWALSSGKKVFGTSVDDCHNITASNQFNAGWVVVHVNSNDKASILDNLRRGNFYSSTGNDISVSVSENVITASSTTSSNITFIGNNGRLLQSNDGVTSVTYTIRGDEGYVRVNSVKVSNSTKAWSNPIFIDVVGDDSRHIIDALKDNCNNSSNRLINGNFDVWQRGTAVTNPSHNSYFAADRYKVFVDGSGFPANIIHSKQTLTSGEIFGSYNYYRINVDGSGTSSMALYRLVNYIENGVRYLCGIGKKVTVSFYARSSIANKKIGVYLFQGYGSGGIPSNGEVINGLNWILQTYWKKYTVTFTTNMLIGKTFGTNNDDALGVTFGYVWDNTFASRFGDTIAETFVGAGNIDIAQVQLCSGDTELPFSPKSFVEELSLCQRYFEKSYSLAVPPGTASSVPGAVLMMLPSNTIASNQRYGMIPYKVQKRISPAVTVYPFTTPTNTGRVSQNSGTDLGAGSGTVTALSNESILVLQNSSGGELITDGNAIICHWTANAEL